MHEYSLRCHLKELKTELGNYDNNPVKIALAETWLTKYAVPVDDLEKHQTIESYPRTSWQDRGRVARFFVYEDNEYKFFEYESIPKQYPKQLMIMW